jgi:hypothetical protein
LYRKKKKRKKKKKNTRFNRPKKKRERKEKENEEEEGWPVTHPLMAGDAHPPSAAIPAHAHPPWYPVAPA